MERRSRQLWWPIELWIFPLIESGLSVLFVATLVRNVILVPAKLIEWISLFVVQRNSWFRTTISLSFILLFKKEFGPPIIGSPSVSTFLYDFSLNWRIIVVLFISICLLLHRSLRRESSSVAMGKELSHHLSLKKYSRNHS